MDSDQALRAKLSTTSGITALCSTRIYPIDLPQDTTLPAVTYQIISAVIESNHGETVVSSLAHAVYQIDAWAATYAEAVALARQIHLALHTFRGAIVLGTETFAVLLCLRTAKRPNKDPEVGLYWISQDYEIWYRE